MANTSASTLLPIALGGPVMKMNPLTQLQVAIKNSVDVFYFSVNVPTHVLFTEDGTMGECVAETEYSVVYKFKCTDLAKI